MINLFSNNQTVSADNLSAASLSLSSYTCSLTPVICRIDSNLYYNSIIIWDMGDGHIYTNTDLVSHVYEWPGVYNIKCVVFQKSISDNWLAYAESATATGPIRYKGYTQEGNILYYDNNDSVVLQINEKEVYTIATVFIHDLVPNSIQLSASSTSLTAGKKSPDIILTRRNSWQDYKDVYSIKLGSDKTQSINDSNAYLNDKWSHLKSHAVFYVNDDINDTVHIPNTHIYAKLSNNIIELTTEPTNDSVFVGSSGSNIINYFDSNTATDVHLFAGFEGSLPYDLQSIGKGQTTNTKTASLTVNIGPNTDTLSGVITTNGINETNFLFGADKFIDTKISFIVTLTDNNNTNQHYNITHSFDDDIVLEYYDGSMWVEATVLNVFDLVVDDAVNYKRGYVIIKESDLPPGALVLFNDRNLQVRFKIGVTIDSVGSTVHSNPFKLFKLGSYQVTKAGENIDLSQIYDRHMIHPALVEKPALTEDIIDTLVGDSSPDQSLGKAIYEKIQNFTYNNSSLDYSNVLSLVSMLDTLKVRYMYQSIQFPPQLQRLIDLFSINTDKLLGTDSQFQEYFNDHSHLQNVNGSTMGNVGGKIDIMTRVLQDQEPIIAYERYSKKYTLINTISLSGSPVFNYTDPVNKTFPLSAWNYTWNWPLDIVNDITLEELGNLYDFFEYVPGVNFVDEESNIVPIQSDGTIIRHHPYTTIPLSADLLKGDNGAIVNMFSDALYRMSGLEVK